MSEKYQSLSAMLDAWTMGVGSTIVGALLGRLMWHVSEARKMRRKIFGLELVWELPMAMGMGMVGEGLAAWLSFGQPASTGLIVALSYFGPRGIEVIFLKWFDRKGGQS